MNIIPTGPSKRDRGSGGERSAGSRDALAQEAEPEAEQTVDGGPRRKGLMIGFETRLTFIGDHNGFDYGTGYQILGSVGYEAF